MKLLRILIAGWAVILISCSKSDNHSEYDLQIGQETIQLPITPDDIQGMEAQALEEIMPLWDNLEEGKSEWFSYSITRPWDEFANDKESHEIVATQIRGSGKWRFFKNPSGEYGIENESNPIATSTNLDRSGIAELVRNNLNGFEPILKSK